VSRDLLSRLPEVSWSADVERSIEGRTSVGCEAGLADAIEAALLSVGGARAALPRPLGLAMAFRAVVDCVGETRCCDANLEDVNK